MKKVVKFLSTAMLVMAIVACSSVSKMVELADTVKVTSEPAVLEVIAGSVDAELTVSFPKSYFNPKAVLEVTPVLEYQGTELKLEPFVYQGAKVKDNFKTISKEGMTVKERIHFAYKKGMEKATLKLRAQVKSGDKVYNLPEKFVASGCNTTYMLAELDGYVPLKKDNYQDVIQQSAEGQILYTVNSSNVRSKELKSNSIKAFKEALKEIKANERKTLKSTEVVAYASPEGSEKFNTKLSGKRANTAGKAWTKTMKGEDVLSPEMKSLGEDWKGFQDLVRKSNIEDKELILRVLSMYSDPAVRESEIRNMSQVFTALKKSILPELRRARFIANVEYKNFTSEELLQNIENNIDILDEEALLRAATLVRNRQDKLALYTKAVEKFDSERAKFNKAAILLSLDNIAEAEAVLKSVKEQDEELDNALGVVALRKGDYKEAKRLFVKSNTKAAKENIGVIYILEGQYKKALEIFEGTNDANEAVLYLLTNQNAKVNSAIKCKCPRADYIRAVAAARMGNTSELTKHLKGARRSKAFEQRMLNDIEFAKFNLKLEE